MLQSVTCLIARFDHFVTPVSAFRLLLSPARRSHQILRFVSSSLHLRFGFGSERMDYNGAVFNSHRRNFLRFRSYKRRSQNRKLFY